jgi:hypothetical protein
MKKMFLLFLIMFPLIVFGQQDSTAIPVPGTVFDIFSDLQGWFASTATVAGLTIFLTLLVAKFWKTMTAIIKQAVALAIAMVLMWAGNIANIGFMADFNTITTIVYGLVVGFMANGLYDLKNIYK